MFVGILFIVLFIWIICLTFMIRGINHVLNNHLNLIYILRDDIIDIKEDKINGS